MAKIPRDPGRRPTHPGALLRLDVLPAMGLTQAQFADALGVSRVSVSQLLHEHRSLSAEMAVQLERVLETSAEAWLGMQQALDLWEARRGVRANAGHFARFGALLEELAELATSEEVANVVRQVETGGGASAYTFDPGTAANEAIERAQYKGIPSSVNLSTNTSTQ